MYIDLPNLDISDSEAFPREQSYPTDLTWVLSEMYKSRIAFLERHASILCLPRRVSELHFFICILLRLLKQTLSGGEVLVKLLSV